MSYDRAGNVGAEVDGGLAEGVAPGKRTRTAAIQRKAAGAADAAATPAPAPAGNEASTGSGPAPEPFWFADGPRAGSGAPLAPAVQARMEHAFQADFSDVKVHQGGNAEAMGAVAYAQGADLHFAPGAYDPGSERGQSLIGHELAHVVQQREGRVDAGPQGKDAPINRDSALEAEADTLGAAAARGEVVRSGPTSLPGGAAAAIQRAIDPDKKDYVNRRVRGEPGTGTILEVVGQGYSVLFDDVPSAIYVPAIDLDFVGGKVENDDKKKRKFVDDKDDKKKREKTDEKKDDNKKDDKKDDKEDVDDDAVEIRTFAYGMADANVLKTAAGGVAAAAKKIGEAGKGWAIVAIRTIVQQLTEAYPGMPPIHLMSLERLKEEKEQLGDSSPDAAFHEDTWEVYVDPKYLELDFSPENLVTLSNFVVHEMRHADQYWRAAKQRVQDGEKDKTVADELGIPENISKLAYASQTNQKLALQGLELIEAGGINDAIPAMNEANEETKQASAYDEMITIAKEFIAHQDDKADWLRKIFEAGKEGGTVLLQWKKTELNKVEDLIKQKLVLVESQKKFDDEDSDGHVALQIQIEAIGQKIEFAVDAVKDIDAYCSKQLTWEKWQDQINAKIEAHENEIEEYKQKVWDAIQAYRNDPLENDGRRCGETFAQELSSALKK